MISAATITVSADRIELPICPETAKFVEILAEIAEREARESDPEVERDAA